MVIGGWFQGRRQATRRSTWRQLGNTTYFDTSPFPDARRAYLREAPEIELAGPMVGERSGARHLPRHQKKSAADERAGAGFR